VHGYIYPEVWETWSKGMRWFYASSKRIKTLWESELRANAYYGLTAEHLRSDRRLTPPAARASAPPSSATASEERRGT